MNQGERIKYLRSSLKITQGELATKLGVTKVTVQRWESGEIVNLKKEKLLSLASCLDTTPEYLLCLVDNPDRKTLFTEERLRFQWEIKHPNQKFDPEAFEEYKKPVDRRHEKIINMIDKMCFSVSLKAENPMSPLLSLREPLSQDDPDFEEYMRNLTKEMTDSLGEINGRRLDAVIELLEQMEEIIKLKIKLSDEISPAEF